MVEAFTTAVATVLEVGGSVLNALVTTDGSLYALLPAFALSVACTLVMFGVKIIKSFTHGA